MVRKQLAGIAATSVLMIGGASPALAWDPNQPWDRHQAAASTVMFYYSIPLEAGASKQDRAPGFGFSVQGRTHRYVIDSRLMSRFDMGTLAGLEVKWLLAGAVAAGAAVAAGSSDGTRQQEQQQSQNTQQQQQSTGSGSGSGSSGGTCPPTPCAQ